jgi:hypothetical protein
MRSEISAVGQAYSVDIPCLQAEYNGILTMDLGLHTQQQDNGMLTDCSLLGRVDAYSSTECILLVDIDRQSQRGIYEKLFIEYY